MRWPNIQSAGTSSTLISNKSVRIPHIVLSTSPHLVSLFALLIDPHLPFLLFHFFLHYTVYMLTLQIINLHFFRHFLIQRIIKLTLLQQVRYAETNFFFLSFMMKHIHAKSKLPLLPQRLPPDKTNVLSWRSPLFLLRFSFIKPHKAKSYNV